METDSCTELGHTETVRPIPRVSRVAHAEEACKSVHASGIRVAVVQFGEGALVQGWKQSGLIHAASSEVCIQMQSPLVMLNPSLQMQSNPPGRFWHSDTVELQLSLPIAHSSMSGEGSSIH